MSKETTEAAPPSEMAWIKAANLEAKAGEIAEAQVGWFKGFPAAALFINTKELKDAIIIAGFVCVFGETTATMREAVKKEGKPAKDLSLPINTAIAKLERDMRKHAEDGLTGRRLMNTRAAYVNQLAVAFAPVINSVFAAMQEQANTPMNDVPVDGGEGK